MRQQNGQRPKFSCLEFQKKKKNGESGEEAVFEERLAENFP